MPERKKLLQVKHLKQYFTSGKSTVKAVDDVTFDIYEGETFGLVGENQVQVKQQQDVVLFVYTIQLMGKLFSMEKMSAS